MRHFTKDTLGKRQVVPQDILIASIKFTAASGANEQ
jgi:hypothetical protein